MLDDKNVDQLPKMIKATLWKEEDSYMWRIFNMRQKMSYGTNK